MTTNAITLVPGDGRRSWRFLRQMSAIGLVAALALVDRSALAANQYFSGRSNTTWDTATADWGSASGGPYTSLWTSGNTAVFEANSNTITVGTGGNPTVGGITFNTNGYTLTGGQLIIGANPLAIVQGVVSANLTNNSVIANGTGANTNVSVSNSSATRGVVTLNGLNTFTGGFTNANTLVSINTIANGGTASSVGQGQNTVPVVICSGSSYAYVYYTGTGGSTDRPWLTGGSGGGGIINNGTGALNFNNPGNSVIGTGSNRSWTFNGTYTAAVSTFAELIADPASGGTTGITCAGSYWALTGANTFSGAVTIFGGGILSVGSVNYVTSGTLSPNTSSALGHPTTAAGGTITFGTTSSYTGGTLKYTGTGETSDRIINFNNSTGGGILDQSGTGLLKFTGGLTVTGVGSKPLTLQGSTAGTGEFAGSIVDDSTGTNHTSVTKAGTGLWTLSGTNTYTGITTVSAGELVMATGGSSSNSIVTVAAGATNGVNVLAANGQWVCAGLTNSTATGCMDFNFGSVGLSTTKAPLQVNGPLVISSSLKIILRGSATVANGQYPLIKYTGTLSGTPPAAPYLLPNGLLASLSNNTANASIDLVVTGTTLYWAVGSGNWDESTLNWKNTSATGVTNADYADGSAVTFDDSTGGASPYLVTNTVTVSPVSVAVSTTNSYTISGSPITGAGALTKYGTGKLTLTGNNSYTGGTTNNAGTLDVFGNQTGVTGSWVTGPTNGIATTTIFDTNSIISVPAASLIQVGIQGSGGNPLQTLLAEGVVTNAGALEVGRSGVLTLTNGCNWVQTGTVEFHPYGGYFATFTVDTNCSFTYSGSHTVGLDGWGSGVNTFIKGGTITTSAGFSNSPAATYASTLVLENGGQIVASANIPNLTTNIVFDLAAGNGIIDNGGFEVGLSGYTTNSTTTTNGIIGAGSLISRGAGTLTLSGVNSYTGNTVISAGTLALTGTAAISNNAAIVVASNAVLDVSGLNSPFTLGSSQTLSNSAPGAIINGTNNCSAGTVALVYDGVNPSFILTNGGMTLSAATLCKVDNTGSALTAGQYLIVAANSGALVAGSLPSVSVNAGGLAANTSASLTLNGGQLYLNVQNTITPTTTTLTTSVSPSTYGQAVTFTATISPAPATTGETITFYDGATAIGTGFNNGSGVATFTTRALAAGSHSLTAVYPGDSGYLASTNTPALAQAVNPAALTITANSTNKAYGQTVTLTKFTVSGLTNSDAVTGATLASAGTGSAAAAGTYPITVSNATGSGLGNYTISYVSGTLTVNAANPVTLNAPVVLGDGTVQLTFTGGDAGVSYRILGNLDLTSTNWTTLTTLVAGTNSLPAYIDTDATNHAARFYQTVTP